MQMNWTDSFKQRLLFGTSQVLVKQIKRAKGDELLEPVYGLGLVAEIYEKTTPDWYHHYRLVKQGVLESDVIEHLQLIFIELPKFPVHSPDEKKLRLLWLRFLREIDEKTKIVSQELLSVPEIAEAVALAEESAYTMGELEIYQSYWDQVRREKTLIADKYNQGKAEGRAEGEVIGETRGIAIGEAKTTEKIAIKMLKAGKSIEEISEMMGLFPEEIKQLKNKILKNDLE